MTEKIVANRYPDAASILVAIDSSFDQEKQLKKVNSIIEKVHLSINKENEQRLLEKQRREAYQEQQDLFNYSIERLIEKIKLIVNAVNASNLSKKISIVPTVDKTNAAKGTLRLTFMGNSLLLAFYNQTIITEYIQHQVQFWKDSQLKHYGAILIGRTVEQIELDKIILMGKVTTSVKKNERFQGFNILLRKSDDDDLYGSWWICEFSERPMFSNVQNSGRFAIDPSDFFKYYQYGRTGVMHEYIMNYRLIEDDDIISLIELMAD